MPTRREFLQAGLAASVIPAVASRQSPGVAAGLRVSTSPHHHTLYRVVSDVRYPASVVLADEAERRGLSVARTNGDITDFWFQDLSVRWKDEPVPIAGLTGRGALFCLERLSWDHGMRVVFRGTHRFVDGQVEHTISGPPATLALARTAGLEDVEWPCAVAHLVGHCEIGGETSSLTLVGVAPRDMHLDADETLVSWVIGPKQV